MASSPGTRCPLNRLLLPLVLLLAAPAARAEGPVEPPPGGDPVDAIKKAAVQITRAMKESEEALTKAARGETSSPRPVDVTLPPSGDATPQKGSPSGGSSEAVQGSADQGRKVVEGINSIIENATKLGGSSGGGGGGKSGQDPKDQTGDPEDGNGDPQRNGKKDQEAKKDPLKDNQKPEDGKDPTSGEKPRDPKQPVNPKGKVPPKDGQEPPANRDLKGIFFAKLPDKVREAVLAGDFDQVPERYRDLIREWTKALAEAEKAEKDAGR